MSQHAISFTVNGTPAAVTVEARQSLADCLRQELELTGTHVGCEHGVCGACTVLLHGQAVRSCLLLAVQAEGADIVTVEGLARDGQLHPLQEAFWEHFALQCGFCTPGFLLTAYEFLQDNPSPSREDIRQALAGNLCRCTGYTALVEAVAAAAQHGRTARD